MNGVHEQSASRVADAAEDAGMIDGFAVGIVATEETSTAGAIADLDRRIRELEAAIGEVRSVKASAAVGRKTASSTMAKSADAAGLDGALGSLSVEQRIAVKSGLLRAGLI